VGNFKNKRAIIPIAKKKSKKGGIFLVMVEIGSIDSK
jgi:hypothetical protein